MDVVRDLLFLTVGHKVRFAVSDIGAQGEVCCGARFAVPDNGAWCKVCCV